jgi:PKD repeat protein
MKTYKSLLTLLFLLFLSSSLFTSLQPTVNAQQANSCPGNLITNGNFTNGLTPGPMPTGAASNWSRAYNSSPDVTPTTGCADAGYIGMWGNQAYGEGLQQQLSSGSQIVAGKTYIISLCARWTFDPPKIPNHVRFRFRASNAPLTSHVTGGVVMGMTPTITLQTWQNYSFIWTATSNFSYVTINPENNQNLLNTPTQTSYAHLDNVCIRELDIVTPPSACLGQPMSFSSNATNETGATSWNWNFGDNKPHSLLPNPTHTYSSAGTYNVTLCVNGMTNCVTEQVTVNPKPPVPVINGPTDLCNGLTATYSVTPVSGATYAWTVSNGTINGPSTGSSVSVTWAPSGGGSIGVTVTNSQGCSSSTKIQVFDCKVWLSQCCDTMHLNTTASAPVSIGGNVYTLAPTFSTPNNVIRVAADIISTEQTFSPASCGTSGPASSYISGASSPSNFAFSQPVYLSRDGIWHSTVSGGVSLAGGVAFPFNIQFPPMPTPQTCSDTLKFCVKYTVTTWNCRSCEIIRCYSITRDHIIDVFNENNQWTDRVAAGNPFTVVVQIKTPEGRRSPGPLTLSIKPGTGARGASLRGQTTAEVVNGTATFGNVFIDRAGDGYVLVMSGPGLPKPLESQPIGVSQDAPRR